MVVPGDTVCSADSTLFVALITNGGQSPIIQWYRNNVPFAGSSDSIYVQGLNTGDEIKCIVKGNAACVTLPTSDTSNIITMFVNNTVVPQVTLNVFPNDTVCDGQGFITMTATVVNGGPNTIYRWLLNNVYTGIDIDSFHITPVTGEAVKCVIISTAACASPINDTSGTITITVLPVLYPTINITASPDTNVINNQQVTFTASVSNGGPSPAYQWAKNGVDINGATASSYVTNVLTDNDVVSCSVKGNNFCDTAISNLLTMHVGSNVAEAGIGTYLVVHPNPAKEKLYVDYDDKINARIEMIDIAGRCVIAQELQHVINIRSLSPGTYFLKITNDLTGMRTTRRFVKE